MSHLYCPRCDKPLEGHDTKGCDRRMSRRYFFGLCAGAGVAAAAPQFIEFASGATIAYNPAAEPLNSYPLRDLYRVMDYTPPGGVYGQARRGIRYELVDADDPRVIPGMIPIRIDPRMAPTEIAIEQCGVEVVRIVNLERRG